MRLTVKHLARTIRNKVWWVLVVVVMTSLMEVASLSGPNVCMVQQKYNITKRVKYRAPMAVRSYVWCFNMPPRCSKWSTEMRDLTKLETEERTAEMAVCCPGYKIKDISCVPICPPGKTGHGCSEDCPLNKWGPNCVHDCKTCHHGSCSPVTGECQCHPGWQGESCHTSLSTTPQPAVQLLITPSSASTKTTSAISTEATSTSSTGTSTATAAITSTTLVPTSTSRVTTESTTSTKESYFTTAMITKLTNAVVFTISVPTYRNETITTLLTTLRPETGHTITNMPIGPIHNEISPSLEYKPDAQDTTKVMIVFPSENISKYTPTITNEKLTTTTVKPKSSTVVTVSNDNLPQTTHLEAVTKAKATTTTIKPTTVKTTTLKFKPKEIWIKPAQKGESFIVETKLKSIHESLKLDVDIKKEIVPENTTPKTIIVSIIPTSVTYVMYKKLALTTSSSTYKTQKNTIHMRHFNKSTQGFTKPVIEQTSTFKPFTIKILNAIAKRANSSSNGNISHQNVTQYSTSTTTTTERNFGTSLSSNGMTNSMISTFNVNSTRLSSSNLLTTLLPTIRNTQGIFPFKNSTHQNTTMNVSLTIEHPNMNNELITIKKKNVTVNPATDILKVTRTISKEVDTNVSKMSSTFDTKTEPVTGNPMKDEETFHILTEPEHITAVMGENGNHRSSIDLISVISIAGGVMMAIITIAVVIVMLERCKKPTYEEVQKYNNDISMQVMIDKNDVPPPPYVRSIFHTPLPEPPIEKCHYQPISTLDQNLKQFMRPVVVQTISPLMLENFRGILECHYDHLPRRSHDFGTIHSRCSLAPSNEECVELLHPRAHSLTDSAIEAMKCEAKQDVIDSTTSEPLYAEIPCWRPPSEHAVEVVNLNGEAVTEL